MHRQQPPRVAIIDYGMGNLFSVQHACASVGLHSILTASAVEVVAADAIVLPGVGAFGDAMQALRALDLVTTLRQCAAAGTPLLGICLGMQLLMTESFEYGRHAGLGLIPGQVRRFAQPLDASGSVLKVPHVGWNRIHATHPSGGALLQGVGNGAFMYFVHSFYVLPDDTSVVSSWARYGHIEFCASLQHRNLFACQFHPERSGPQGLRIYQNFAALLACASTRTDEPGADHDTPVGVGKGGL